MTIGQAPICMGCKNYNRLDADKLSCTAFPQGIPDKIIMGEVSHREHVEGDKGIKFEPLSQEEAEAFKRAGL